MDFLIDEILRDNKVLVTGESFSTPWLVEFQNGDFHSLHNDYNLTELVKSI